MKNNLPCLHVGDCQEGFFCLLVISAVSFCLFNCIHARQCSSSTSLESFRVFPTLADFEFTLQGNLHPADLVMQQVFKESGVNLSGNWLLNFQAVDCFSSSHQGVDLNCCHSFFLMFFEQNVQLVVLTKS